MATSPSLFVIATALAVVRIDATIDAKERLGIRASEKVTFTVEALPNRTFAGTVAQIRPPPPRIGGPAATTDLVIEAPNPDLALRPGMAARIRILPE